MIPETTIVTITIVIFPNIVILPNSTRHILLITLNMNGCNIQIPVLVDNTLILLEESFNGILVTNKNKTTTPKTTGIDGYIDDAHMLLVIYESKFKLKIETSNITTKIHLLYLISSISFK